MSTEKKKIIPKDRITPEEFDPARLCSVTASTKQIETATSKVDVVTVEYQYDYRYIDENGEEKPYISDLKVQFPKLISKAGIKITEVVDKDKAPVLDFNGKPKIKSRIGVRFDMSNEDHKNCASYSPIEEGSEIGFGFYQKLQWGLSEKMTVIRGQLGTTYATKKKASDIAGSFRPFLYFKGSSDGSWQEGVPVDHYFDLKAWGAEGTPERNETPFSYSKKKNGKVEIVNIPWSALKNAKVEFMPLVSFPKLIIASGLISLKEQIASAVVIDFKKNADEILQDDLLRSIAEEENSNVTEMEKKISELMKLQRGPSDNLPIAPLLENGKGSRETKTPNLGKGIPLIPDEEGDAVSDDEEERKEAEMKKQKLQRDKEKAKAKAELLARVKAEEEAAEEVEKKESGDEKGGDDDEDEDEDEELVAKRAELERKKKLAKAKAAKAKEEEDA